MMTRLLSLVHLAAFAGSSCSQTEPVAGEPPGAQLSGTYTFEGLGDNEAYQFPNPLLDFAEIRPGTSVYLLQKGDELECHSTDKAGRRVSRAINLAALPDHVAWAGGVLKTTVREPIHDGFILPGSARHYRGTTISRAVDGSLRIDGFFIEKGRLLFVAPFTDHDEYHLTLKPRER